QEVCLITNAYTNTEQLQSYHYDLQASGGPYPQPMDVPGDYVASASSVPGLFSGAAPNVVLLVSSYFQSTTNFQAVGQENMHGVQVTEFTGDIDSLKFRDVVCEAQTSPSTSDVMQLMMSLLKPDCREFELTQGVAGLPSLGTVSVWVDPKTQLVHKIFVNADS